MNTIESIQNKIVKINETLLHSIEDKTLFDDCFKDCIIHIKRKNCQPPAYKKRNVTCPVYQKPFEYDVTKKFSKKSFESFKKTVNNCILLNALSDLMIFNKLLTEGFNKPDNIYYRIFKTFAHKKDSNSTELFMESVKECNASIKIFIVNVNILIQPFHYTNNIMYMVRVGTEFENE